MLRPSAPPIPPTRRILDRLRRYDLELLGPGAPSPGGTTVCEIRGFRASVYKEFGSLPPQGDESGDEGIDRDAWHLVARSDTGLVGCIRFTLFDEAHAADLPSRVIANSRCCFSLEDHERCRLALRAHVRKLAAYGGAIVQYGGMAVSRTARGSVVAAALCLAGTAFTRVIGSPGGILLASEKSGSASLYEKAGAVRLSHRGAVLAPFADAFHRDRIVVMVSSPRATAPELEPVVTALQSAVGDMIGLLEARCA